MQSGISASQELQSALADLITSTTTRGLTATISNERIVPGPTIPSTNSTFLSDLSNLSPHIQPNAAAYFLLRRADALSSSDKSLVAVTYVPNAAPVRQKMLFASTRLTLVRELGGEHFPESVFCTEADELTAQGWERHVKHTESENPLTAEEQSLQDIKAAEALESRGTRGQGLAQGGQLAMRADDAISGALRALGEGGGAENLVMLGMDGKTETLQLVSSSSVDAAGLAKAIDAGEPRFSFYRHSDEAGSIVFISTCPSGAKIRDRMLYAASRGNVIGLAQKEGVKVAKKIEATNPEEITEGVVLEEFKTEMVEEKKGFAKPKRPGRR